MPLITQCIKYGFFALTEYVSQDILDGQRLKKNLKEKNKRRKYYLKKHNFHIVNLKCLKTCLS